MMKKNSYIFRTILSFLLLVLILPSCKKDKFCTDDTNPYCPNYDPCAIFTPANADFLTVVNTWASDTVVDIEVDTTGARYNLYFKAIPQESPRLCEWRVGTDSRVFEGEVLNLGFRGFEGELDVTLTTTVLDEEGCLEADELVATKTKQIYFIESNENAPLWGVFKGRHTEGGDDYEITVERRTGGFGIYSRLFGLNLPVDCDYSNRGIPLSTGYAYFVSAFRSESPADFGGCRNLIVIGEIDRTNRNKIQIDYWYNADDGSRKHEVFIGYRQ